MNNPAKALIDGLFDQMVGPTHETQGTPIDFMTDRPETTECAGCGDTVLEGTISPDGHLCEECDACEDDAHSPPTLDEVAVESCCFYGEYLAPDTAQVLGRIADYHKVGKKHAGTSLDASIEAGLVWMDGNQVDLAWKGIALAIEKGWMQENDAQWDRLMATTEVPEESNEDEEPQLYTVKELAAQQRVAAEIAWADIRAEIAQAAQESPEADDTAQAPEASQAALTFGTAEEGTFVTTPTGKLRLVVKIGKVVRVVRKTPRGDFVTDYATTGAPCFPTRPPHSVRVAAYRVLSEKDRKRLGIDLLLGAAAARAVASAPKAPAPKATPTSREGQPVGFSVQDFRAMEELVEGMTYRLALCETQQIHVEKKFDALVNGLAALIHEVRS